MKEIIPNDNHYLAICWVLTVALQLSFFAVAYGLQIDKVTDFAGSTNFILIALLTFFANGAYTSRQIAITVLVCIARAELAGYLLYRVCKRGKDERFDAMRSKCASFFGFWVFQMVWAWGVSLPVMYVNGDPTNPPFGDPSDVAGIIVFVLGFLLEVAADFQKDAFRSNPDNRGKVCDVGVWYYSRHPNFAGEIFLWLGIFIIGVPVYKASADLPTAIFGSGYGWGFACILSPILTFVILMILSGMPTAEGDNQKRFMKTRRQKAEFLAYRRRTSPLVPLPPCMYGALPLWVKRWLLFEWPLYETDWTYCGEEEGRGLGLGSGVLPPEALAASAAYSAAASPSLHTRLSVHPPVLGSEPVGAGAAGGGGSSSGAGPDSVVVNAMAPSNGAPRY